MQFPTATILAAVAFFGLGTNAACTIQGFAEKGCKGPSGNPVNVPSDGRCVGMSGRQAYRLSDDCNKVEVNFCGSSDCGSDRLNNLTKGSGCYLVSAASVGVKTI